MVKTVVGKVRGRVPLPASDLVIVLVASFRSSGGLDVDFADSETMIAE